MDSEFWYSWRHQIPEFAKDFKVVALDLRGYTTVTSRKSNRLMAQFIKDVEGDQGTGDTRGVSSLDMIGRCDRLSFAYAHPEMVERLIVNCLSEIRGRFALLNSCYVARTSSSFSYRGWNCSTVVRLPSD